MACRHRQVFRRRDHQQDPRGDRHLLEPCRGADLRGTGRPRMIGQSITCIIPEERTAEEEQILERIRRGETVEHLETVRVTKDGRKIDISLTSSPIRDAGGESSAPQDRPRHHGADASLRGRSSKPGPHSRDLRSRVGRHPHRGSARDDHLGQSKERRDVPVILTRACSDSRWRCSCPSACGAGTSAIAPRTSRIPMRDRWVVVSTWWPGEPMARSSRWRSP